MYNTRKKIVIWQLQNAKSNFPNFRQVYARQKKIYKSGSFIYTVSKNLCFNSKFKNRFQEAFLLKVIDTKKIHYMHLSF